MTKSALSSLNRLCSSSKYNYLVKPYFFLFLITTHSSFYLFKFLEPVFRLFFASQSDWLSNHRATARATGAGTPHRDVNEMSGMRDLGECLQTWMFLGQPHHRFLPPPFLLSLLLLPSTAIRIWSPFFWSQLLPPSLLSLPSYLLNHSSSIFPLASVPFLLALPEIKTFYQRSSLIFPLPSASVPPRSSVLFLLALLKVRSFLIFPQPSVPSLLALPSLRTFCQRSFWIFSRILAFHPACR